MSLERTIRRKKNKELMKSMKLKRRLYQLDLRDTDLTVYLHNPSVQDFDVYLTKMQSFSQISDALSGLQSGGIVNISDPIKDDLYALVSMVADLIEGKQRRPMELSEVQQLTIWDCICVIKAMQTMTENALNPTPAAATQETEPLT